MKRNFIESLIATSVLTILLFVSINFSTAQVSSSTNYQIQSDSLNFGGGFSSSTNYQQESTFGEVGTGRATSTSYQLRAGYQQMQEVYLSITAAADVIMDTELPGLTGGTSNGSTTVTVTTDSPAGYSLTIETEGDPAMQSAGGSLSIPDYEEGAEADFSFTVAATEARFGYSPSGIDIVQAFRDDTSLCNQGSADTPLACWAGLTTSATEIARGATNHPDGATTTVNFRVGIGGTASVLSGVYTATTTLTALPL